ncbi:hypothetical protein JCM8097_004438 [Rhodosporidiobolus ruineniae]
MPRFAPYVDPDAAPRPPSRWKHSAPLRSTSTHNRLSTASETPTEDYKGKGKAGESVGGAAGPKKLAKAWKDVDALLNQSFTAHRLASVANPPFSSSSSSSDLKQFSTSLRPFLAKGLVGDSLDGTPASSGSSPVKRVEAGFVDLPMFGKEGSKVRPVLLEVERGDAEEGTEASTSRAASTSRTSTFIFLPSPSSDDYPLLLTKSTCPRVTSLVHLYLSTRYDAVLLPYRIPPPTMLDLLETVVQNRDTSFDEVDVEVGEADKGLATSATFAFPAEVAKDGLSTLTLTLPPAILPFLARASASSSFTTNLSSHLHSLTSLTLSSLFLVRFGAGRGTFIHSGQGAGDAGARVKFFRGAEDGDEVKLVLEGLVRAAEGKRT